MIKKVSFVDFLTQFYIELDIDPDIAPQHFKNYLNTKCMGDGLLNSCNGDVIEAGCRLLAWDIFNNIPTLFNQSDIITVFTDSKDRISLDGSQGVTLVKLNRTEVDEYMFEVDDISLEALCEQEVNL